MCSYLVYKAEGDMLFWFGFTTPVLLVRYIRAMLIIKTIEE